jgi:hypothetical protein
LRQNFYDEVLVKMHGLNSVPRCRRGRGFRRRLGFRLLATWVSVVCASTYAGAAAAYDVESDSTTNAVYVLLRNLNPSVDFVSITVGDALPAFVPVASATLVPASVAAGESDLAAIEFDVSAAATLGQTGDIQVTLGGLQNGTPTDVILRIPLEVVASAAAAQGEVGVGVPAPDPGGADTDGDGVTDALEVAFGSDPVNANSVPGKLASAVVPGLGAVAGITLLGLVLTSGWVLSQRQPRLGAS